MSYSFTVRAANKADAIAAVGREFTKVLQNQPIHSADQTQALAAAESFINLLVADEARDISVGVSGSIWQSDTGIRQAQVGVSASIVDREPS